MTKTLTRSKFGRMSHKDALLESETRETWLIDGLISATSTLVYGEAKVGKSFLMSAMIAALITGEDYLGRPVPQDREFKVAVCWTDDGGAADYASQIQGVIPESISPSVDYYMLPSMQTQSDWADLHDEIIANGTTLVVIDNMTQALNGSINHDEPVRAFFTGVRLLTRSGIPVVVVGHSSDKSSDNGWKSDKPMGNSTISQSVRWRCFVKRSRSGNLTLRFSGNHAESHELTVKHGAGARFEVIDQKSAATIKAADEARGTQRSKDTLDKNAEMARWIVAECQGRGVNATGRALAAKFGGNEHTLKTSLSTGALAQLVDRQGEGQGTTWSLSERMGG